jgi:hypothetical protein
MSSSGPARASGIGYEKAVLNSERLGEATWWLCENDRIGGRDHLGTGLGLTCSLMEPDTYPCFSSVLFVIQANTDE